MKAALKFLNQVRKYKIFFFGRLIKNVLFFPDPFTNANTNSNPASRPKFVKHEFSFDRVFNPSASQQDVFDELSQLVQVIF